MFSKLFSKKKSKTKQKESFSFDVENNVYLSMFLQNVAILKKEINENDSIDLFGRIIEDFENTFKEIESMIMNEEIIKESVLSFIECAPKFVDKCFLSKHMMSKLSFSLNFVTRAYGNIPSPNTFLSFLNQLLQVQNLEFLPLFYPFLSSILKSNVFFKEFLELDGLCVLFSSAFIQSSNDEIQDFFIATLFSSISHDYFVVPQSKAIYDLFSTVMTSNEFSNIHWLNVIRFIIKFLIRFKGHGSIETFQEINGFNSINSSLHTCLEESHLLYKEMITGLDLYPTVLKCFFVYYSSFSLPEKVKYSHICVYNEIIRSHSPRYLRIEECVPFKEWLKFSFTNNNSIDILLKLLSFLQRQGLYSIKIVLPLLISLVESSTVTSIIIEEVFEVILVEINSHRLTPEELYHNFMFSFFVENKSFGMRIAKQSKSFIEILILVYPFSNHIPIIKTIVEELINTNDSKLQILLLQLSKIRFDCHSTQLLFQYFPNQVIIDLFIEIAQINPNLFSYLMVCEFLDFIEGVIYDSPSSATKLIKLLSNLCTYGPHFEIDEWIFSLKDDSAIYGCSKEFLYGAAFSFNTNNEIIRIPSLLPFNSSISFLTQANLFMIGKYSIPIYIKHGDNILSLEIINLVANQYLDPRAFKFLCTNFKMMDSYMVPSFNHFSFFHLFPSYTSKIVFNESFISLSFWMSIPKQHSQKSVVMTTSLLTVYSIEDKILISTNREEKSFEINYCKWYNLVVCYYTMKNVSQSVEVFVNQTKIGQLTTFSEPIPAQVIFGGEKSASSIFIAPSIRVFNRILYEDDIALLYHSGPSSMKRHLFESFPQFSISNALNVTYLGFSSYFSTLESLYILMDSLNSTDSNEVFNVLFRSIVRIQRIQCLDILAVWKLLLFNLKHSYKYQNSLSDILFDIPKSEYSFDEFCDYFLILIQDLELFSIFHSDIMCNCIKIIGNHIENNITRINDDFKDKIIKHILYLVPCGIDINVQSSLIQFFWFLFVKMSLNQKSLFFSCIVSCSESICFSPLEININKEWFEQPVSESLIQDKLLDVFSSVIQKSSTINFSYEDISLLMLVFKDHRSIKLAECISFCSKKFDGFIIPSKTAESAFSSLSAFPEIWEIAFGILSSDNIKMSFPSKIREIKQPIFIDVVLMMMITLLSNENWDEANEKQAIMIFESIGSLSSHSFSKLSTNSCIEKLYYLFSRCINEDHSLMASTNKLITFEPFMKEIDHLFSYDSLFLNHFLNNNFENIRNVFNNETHNMNPFSFNSMPKRIAQNLYGFISKCIIYSEPHGFNEILQRFFIVPLTNYSKDKIVIFSEIFHSVMIHLVMGKFTVEYHINPLLVTYFSQLKITSGDAHLIRIIPILFTLISHIISTDSSSFNMIDVSIFKDIALFCFLHSETDLQEELYSLVIQNKELFFSQFIFDLSFTIVWMKIIGEIPTTNALFNKIQALSSPFISKHQLESINIESSFRNKIDQLKSYKPKYNDNKYTNDQKNRLQTNNILFLTSVYYRVLSFHIYYQNQFYYINQWYRNEEQAAFCIINRYSSDKVIMKSVATRSSFLSMPLYYSRIMCPTLVNIELNDSVLDYPSFLSRFLYKPNDTYLPEMAFYGKGALSCIESQNSETKTESKVSYYVHQSYIKLFHHFKQVFYEYGVFDRVYNCEFLYCVSSIKSVVLLSDQYLCILLNSLYQEDDLLLLNSFDSISSSLSLMDSIIFGDFSYVSKFCGHYAIFISYKSLAFVMMHYYINELKALSIFSLFSQEIILVFPSFDISSIVFEVLSEFIKNSDCFVNQLPENLFLFQIKSEIIAQSLWKTNQISNFQYISLLNTFSGRSMIDFSQYHVLPWIQSPEKGPRDLAKPMGQLNDNRAKQYDDVFTSVEPSYFYGCHYSLPGVINWFLMRSLPFLLFNWEQNNGWDDPNRMFCSIQKAYLSASEQNTTDLKELIPQLFYLPEIYNNTTGVTLPKIVFDMVEIPLWANNNYYFFTETMMKSLEDSESINFWIDLIFGYQQQGDEAIKAKNLFHPTAYHSTKPDDIGYDEDSFRTQVLNFGQCPNQLFFEKHQSRSIHSPGNPLSFIPQLVEDRSSPSFQSYCNGFCIGYYNDQVFYLPPLSKTFPNNSLFFLSKEGFSLNIKTVQNDSNIFSLFDPSIEFIKHIDISECGLFVVFSFLNNLIKVYRIIYTNGYPASLRFVKSYISSESPYMSAILEKDYVVASIFPKYIVFWSFANGRTLKKIYSDIIPHSMFFDDLNGSLYIGSSKQVYQYSINGKLLSTIDISSTCMSLVKYGQTFDKRYILIGSTDGTICILSKSEHNYDFETLCSRKISKSCVKAMFVDNTKRIIVIHCNNGSIFVTKNCF